MSDQAVRPDVAAFLTAAARGTAAPLATLQAADARQLMLGMVGVVERDAAPLAVVRDLAMPAPHGGEIALRLFDARDDRAPGPVVVFLHGGGWVLGDLDCYAPLCAEIARLTDMPVVAADYRLAPEHPWSAAPDDCEAAARWIAAAPPVLGLRPTALVLAGDSAGGNLAIVTAMALRDVPAAVPVAAHWAIYPATDMTMRYPSADSFGQGFFLDDESMAWFDRAYRADRDHWRASPLRGRLDGLPPALVTTAALDPLRDQGRAYAAALIAAGVDVTYREAAGTIHGFLTMRRAIPSGQADLATYATALTGIVTQEPAA